MKKKVLIISSSPRRGGNTDVLCDEFMRGAYEAGHEVEKVFPPYIEEKVPITIGTQSFMLSVFDNPAGRAFKALLPLTISMEDVNGNEKFYRLSQGLPQTAANPGTI